MAVYVPSQFMAQGLGFLTALVMRHFLGPIGMGIWGTIQIVMTYAGYSHMGIQTNIFYRVPILKGKGKEEQLKNLQNLVFTFLIASISLIAIGLLVYATIFKQTLSDEIYVGLMVSSLILIAQRIRAFYVTLLRAQMKFELLSKVVVCDAAINLILVLLMVGRWGFYGLLGTAILIPILNIIYIETQERIHMGFRWSFVEFVECLKYGFPIFVRDWLNNILNSIDKLMIVSLLGVKSLGYFSISTMTRNYSHGLYRNFSHVISPYLLEEFGRSSDLRTSAKYVEVPTLILAYFMAFVLGSAYILSECLVAYVLPEFVVGLPALRIYLVAALFTILSTQSTTFITALKKQIKLIPIVLMAIIMNIVLNYSFIKQGYDIFGVAVATSISSGITFLVTYSYAMKHVDRWVSIVFQLLRMCVPLFVAFVLVTQLHQHIICKYLWLSTLIQWGLFVILMSPLLFLLNYSTKIFSFLFKWYLERNK